jgi:serine/threonine protein kinase
MEFVEGENLQQFLANTGGRCGFLRPSSRPHAGSASSERPTDPLPPHPTAPPPTHTINQPTHPQNNDRASEALARFLFQQLVLALDFCHRKGKVSRDVKLANTLLALGANQLPLVKLCDFGYSKDTMLHSAPASQVGGCVWGQLLVAQW